VLRVKSPAFLAIILLLIITNVITAEVVSRHKSDSSASAKVSASTHTYKAPADLVKNSQKEAGKDVTVTGTIVKSDTTYYVVGQGKSPVALKLDFSKTSLDPNNYVAPAATDTGKPVTAKQYTVSGTLSAVDKNSFLLVKSVK
jgi:hypothetical protein